MFDRVEINVRSGDGGDGGVSFRREKYVPFGGPDGGDGGRGGDVVLLADPGTDSLLAYNQHSFLKAGRGENGRGQKKHGKNGEDLVLKVPVGTLVLDKDMPPEQSLLADCDKPDERYIIAHGGKGGLGNTRFATSTNQAPRLAQKGDEGERLSIVLELRLIADVGITGYPNAGKSTLLTSASAARPRIASYPFTTLRPMLGMVEQGLKRFVMADIPGLIDGAHLGKGLGHDFLRHIMRTRVLIHLMDGSALSPAEDYVHVNEELRLFDTSLAMKPQLVVVNKIDIPEVRERMDEIKQSFRDIGTPVIFISAATGEGVEKLMADTLKLLEEAGTGPAPSAGKKRAIFRPKAREAVRVSKAGEVFVIESHELDRLVSRVDMNDPEVYRQMQRQMGRLGVNKALEKAGIAPGDRVRCGESEWEW